jgi:MOSC domain-containing protein YiiM
MSLTGRLVSIQISPDGGVPKMPLPHADVDSHGIIGDRQRNTARHGGPLRAVSLYAVERITALQAEGHPISPGSTGENLTLSGIDWSRLQPGAVLQIGDWVELEVLSYVTPCATISASFRDGDFQRIAQPRFPGWSRLYTRVLSPGRLSVGDAVAVTLPA